MTPFTEATAAAAGSRGGSKRTRAQRRALRMGGEARRGAGYVPSDPSAVMGVLAAVKRATLLSRKGGSPPDPRSVRSLAASIGVTDATVRRWFAGKSWPKPEQVDELELWIRRIAL